MTERATFKPLRCVSSSTHQPSHVTQQGPSVAEGQQAVLAAQVYGLTRPDQTLPSSKGESYHLPRCLLSVFTRTDCSRNCYQVPRTQSVARESWSPALSL